MAAVIDWDLAMDQVGGDKDFLNEIIEDLLKETDEAEIAISSAIEDKNIIKVQREAHKVKGSASYLCCYQLQEISNKLQHFGKVSTTGEQQGLTAEEWIEIEKNFAIFKQAVIDLKTEIANKP